MITKAPSHRERFSQRDEFSFLSLSRQKFSSCLESEKSEEEKFCHRKMLCLKLLSFAPAVKNRTFVVRRLMTNLQLFQLLIELDSDFRGVFLEFSSRVSENFDSRDPS
jgi:hypothetical protein